MKTLILGASGATGSLLADQLLGKGQEIKVIVRPPAKIPESWTNNGNITIIKANLAEMSVNEQVNHLADSNAVAICLGHNMSLKGIYGKPRKLVTDAVRLCCEAIKINTSEKPIKIVLMNTAGNRNRDLAEPVSIGEKILTGMLRVLLPPHPDNEQAADYLRVNIGEKDKDVEWVVVRPDSLTDDREVTEYTSHPSPTRSAIFNPGKTSRINVANFMANLLADEKLWKTRKGQMPVIYNVEG